MDAAYDKSPSQLYKCVISSHWWSANIANQAKYIPPICATTRGNGQSLWQEEKGKERSLVYPGFSWNLVLNLAEHPTLL